MEVSGSDSLAWSSVVDVVEDPPDEWPVDAEVPEALPIPSVEELVPLPPPM